MELLNKLTQTYSPSGSEEQIRALIESEVAPYADEVYTDNLGNLIVRKRGNGNKIMLSAHMDEIGLLVNYIEDNGFLRFSPVGGIMPYCALYQSVVFQNGIKGTVAYEEKIDLKKEFDITKMYIDIGASNAEEAENMISLGDCAVFCGEFSHHGDILTSKAMDNRAGVYVLIRVLRALKEVKNDLYFVFSSQEELGLRGAKAAANAISPHIGLAVDVTDTGDTPNCNRMAVKLGKGACIKLMDNSIITHKIVNDALKASADRVGAPVQYEVLSLGGTDAGAIHTSGTGVMTGAVSIPTRYIHTPRETVNMNDIIGAVDIITDFVNSDF
ncbi:MAG: M42 family metallopeptidase [Clostridia bacterium]|nr:M42 family metallopeptidase [Clostridia bacterium]